MIRFRELARQSGYANRIATWGLAMILFLAPMPGPGKSAHGQAVQEPSAEQANSATLQGSVRDGRGRPVAAATVYLQAATGTQTLTVRTNSEGDYHFPALGEGVYILRAEMAGYGEATFGPCVVGPKEAKRVDLILKSAAVSTPRTATSAGEQPQFFDEPQFTVAGVTEAMNPGGHGSEMILRTTEALAKETASLGATPVNNESNSSQTTLLSTTSAQESLSHLERASQLNPGDYGTDYKLALAYVNAGQYERGRTQAQTLLARANESALQQSELHHLLADVEEKLGNPLEAVHEYQRAADLNPSEPNLFDWGSELLMHRAYEPAIDVFTKGNRLFPHSVRMLTGLGAAWYARGSYDLAARHLCEASDLNPDDPKPYLFLGKMQSVRTMQSECLVERLQRFAQLQPGNALANYYYALSLWNRHESLGRVENLAPVESLLDKAIQLDPKFGAAYLQLGILYSEQGDSAKAIAAYQRATETNPGLEEAHYRLARAYSRAGEESKAEAELRLYEQLSKKAAEQVEHERGEIQQFVYTLRDTNSPQR